MNRLSTCLVGLSLLFLTACNSPFGILDVTETRSFAGRAADAATTSERELERVELAKREAEILVWDGLSKEEEIKKSAAHCVKLYK